jgi:hypothetical protein
MHTPKRPQASQVASYQVSSQLMAVHLCQGSPTQRSHARKEDSQERIFDPAAVDEPSALQFPKVRVDGLAVVTRHVDRASLRRVVHAWLDEDSVAFSHRVMDRSEAREQFLQKTRVEVHRSPASRP